jgi:hypothetical protein
MTRPPYGRMAVSIERTITTGRGGVAAQLLRDRRRRPVQPARDLPDTQTSEAQVGDLDPFVLG